MQRWRLFFGNLAMVATSVAVGIILLELIFRFLPVAVAPPVQEPTLANKIQRYAPNTHFTWSLGWDFNVVVHGRTNAQGFVADYDYNANATTPLVAVVGDSYVEALMVPFAESLTGRLQAMLGHNGRAYAFAQSGSPLSQYVAYAQYACAVYRPQRLVVVIVGNDFDESVFSHRLLGGIYHLHPRSDGGFDYRLTPPVAHGPLERTLRHSSLALYLVRNVGIMGLVERFMPTPAKPADEPAAYVGNTAAAAGAGRLAEGERVIAWFLEMLPSAACLPPEDILLIVDAMRPQIYDNAALAAARTSYFGRMRRSLMTHARMHGFRVVDLEPRFREAYAAERHPFEFPNNGHWNVRGHMVAAEAVRKALGDWPPLTASWRAN